MTDSKTWVDKAKERLAPVLQEMGGFLVIVASLFVVMPTVFLFFMSGLKRQDLGWGNWVVLGVASVGVTIVAGLGISWVGHAALTLRVSRWLRGLLLTSWAGLSLLLVCAVTLVLVMVSSEAPYLAVIQPDYIKENLPNFVVCFAFSALTDLTLICVMGVGALKKTEADDDEKRELEKDKDRAIGDRNTAQAKAAQLLEHVQTLQAENVELRADKETLSEDVAKLTAQVFELEA